jgi:hypothetical protein
MDDELVCAAAYWPLLIAAGGLCLAVAGAVWLAVSPAGPADGRGRIVRIAACVAGALFMACAAACVVVVCSAVGFFKTWEPFKASSSVGEECAPWILGGTVLVVLSILAGGAGLAVRLGRPAGQRARSAAPAVVMLVLGLVAVLPALYEAAWLGWIGPYPWIDLERLPRVHVGRKLTVTPEVLGAGGPEVWVPVEVEVDAREPGEQEVALVARRLLVQVRRTVVVERGADRADPLLPLVVGNRWTYRQRAERHDQLLWFLPVNHEYEGPEVDGLHVYWIETRVDEVQPSVDEVYNWNGRVHGLDGEPYVQVVTLEQAEAMDNVADLPETGEAGVLCRVGVFPSSMCTCLEQPEGRAALPGPARCVQMQSSDSDALATLASLAFGLATAGLVVPDFDSDVRWELVESKAR